MPIELLGKEVRFLVPVLRNTDKQHHEPELWEWIEFEMYAVFPAGWQQRGMERIGNTVSGRIHGRWFDKSKNEHVPDICVEYVVAMKEFRHSFDRDLFEQLCARFDQKCLYFTSGGDASLYYPTAIPEPNEND